MGIDLAVLVPGLGLGPEAWAPTLRRLRTPVPTTVRTLPGYGERAAGHDLDPRSLAELLVDRLGPLGARVVLAGHSASCQVAAHAAVLLGQRAAGLVLVGPTTDPRASSWPALAARWLRTAAHETPRQVPTLVRQYARTTLPSIVRAMDAARHDRIDEVLRDSTRQLLVIRGTHDRICPDDWGRRVSALSASGDLVTLPRGGHMVPLTHGELVAPVLDRLLAEQHSG